MTLIGRALQLPNSGQGYSMIMVIIMAIYMICRCINTVTISGVLDSGGETVFDMCSSIIGVWCITIPSALLAYYVFGLDMMIVSACICFGEIGRIPSAIFRFRKYKWVRDLTR
jgi:Na+-driven multidrug efflux pump